MIHKSSYLIAGFFLLTACESWINTEKDFLCSAQTGQPCRSIADVDGASLLGGGSLREAATDTNNKQITEVPLATPKGVVASSVVVGQAAYQSTRYRIPEKVGRLWIAPYLGAEGILYEGTNVHFVIRQASWGSR